MKKKFSFLIVLLIMTAGKPVFSQKPGGACPQGDLTMELCKVSDSLASFFKNIKKSSSADAWARFTEDAALGPVAAFENFDERGKEWRETFIQLGNDLDKKAMSLISEIDPAGNLSGERVKNEMISRVSCYYANDPKIPVKDGDDPVPERLDGGPCEIAANTCLSQAAATHTTQLINCGFGSGNIWKWLGGWFGAGAGLLCLIGAESTYNNAKMTCFNNYCLCIKCED